MYETATYLVLEFCSYCKDPIKTLKHLFLKYPFSTLWNHQIVLRISDIFRGYKNSTLETNGVKKCWQLKKMSLINTSFCNNLTCSVAYAGLSHFVKSVLIQSYSGQAFSSIRTEYGQIRIISPFSVQTRENTDQNNSENERRLVITAIISAKGRCKKLFWPPKNTLPN